jgi:TRAP-type mannitol/chloroaromatic compound transport system substrate-binding protein
MQRRHLIHAATLAATGATLAACGAPKKPSSETNSNDALLGNLPKIQWRMATSWSKMTPIAQGGAEIIAKRVSEMTEGQFVITPYVAGELTPGLEVLDAVQSGIVECGHTVNYYYAKQYPALVFASTVPFGLTAYQQNAWMYGGGGIDALNVVYAKLGVMGFPAGNTGAQMGGWFTQPINTLADLKGLKMRIPGLGGKVLEKLGVEVKLLAGGEIYAALEKGEIDAAEWQGPNDDQSLGLNSIASHYYYPGWWEPGTNYSVMVNLTQWQKLPLAYQEIFQAAAAEADLTVLAQYDVANADKMNQIRLEGTSLLPFSDEILQAAHKVSFAMYADLAEQDADFKLVYENWNAFRKQIQAWNRVNELSFADFALSRSVINQNDASVN